MYSLLRNALFLLPPEAAHTATLNMLSLVHRLGLMPTIVQKPKPSPVTAMGLTFPNPVGLAAGLDKNADYIDALGALGFGFIEVGTVTPRPQEGNPKPRMFRLPEYSALINRMGFNNKGVDHLVSRLKTRRFDGIVGVNIGKNKMTPAEHAADDYLHCLKKVYPFADYVTVNISSPNTPGLRDLQYGEQLEKLLGIIARERSVLERIFHRHVPVLIKIAPDLENDEIEPLIRKVVDFDFQGVIATNTTSEKSAVARNSLWQESGGLSGKPLGKRSNHVLRKVRDVLPDDRVLVGVGGIVDGQQAVIKMGLGADLVQIYSGLVFAGPALIGECVQAINEFHQHRSNKSLAKQNVG